MPKKPTFGDFVEELGPERYYMDGELSRSQAEKYWRQVYNSRYGRKAATLRSNLVKVAAKGSSNG